MGTWPAAEGNMYGKLFLGLGENQQFEMHQ